MHSHHSDTHMLHARQLLERPGPVPAFRLDALLQARSPTLDSRSPDSTSSSLSGDPTTPCGPKDTTGPCQRLTTASSNDNSLPIILGVVIPLTVAFIVLIYLHRRHVKKLRQEDAEDKHKSLDFGMDGNGVMVKKNRKGGKGAPEMSAVDARRAIGKDRGLSLDLTLTNPYLLPPELQQSRESLHSLSRNGDDKYRATNFIPDDGSIRSPSSLRGRDDASIYTSSSRQRTGSESTKGLLPASQNPHGKPMPQIQKPAPVAKDNNSLLTPNAGEMPRDSYLSTASSTGNVAALRASNNYLGQFISGGVKKESRDEKQAESNVAELVGDSPHHELPAPPPAASRDASVKRQSVEQQAAGFDFEIPPNTYELSSGPEPTLPQFDLTPAEETSPQIHEAPGHDVLREKTNYADSHNHLTAQPTVNEPQQENQKRLAPPSHRISEYENESDYYDEEETEESYDINAYKEALGYDPRLLTMGMRPLPPDDPAENPEERALRIRSFYKEYFDDTAKPGGEKARLSYFDGSENYIDDYYGSYAQPAYSQRGPSAMSARGPYGRHRATVSNGSYARSGQRAYSSASQRYPGSQMRHVPKKKLPPPQPLMVLPTPSKLTEDSMLPNAIDFAPPQVFKNQRSGTPDSPRGGLRPYSPSTRAYNPLVSSFDDLSVLPSPHLLRKSGTFTSLDFAPPRFVGQSANGSETGSIRSNKSGMSAAQLHNIRSGAYRISRIPKEVAGTKEELATALRPQWNAR